MSIALHSVCGRTMSVSEGLAGSDVRCECGQTVLVPSLINLQAKDVHNPLDLIREGLATGQIPPRVCAGCSGLPTVRQQLFADCEQAKWQRAGDGGGYDSVSRGLLWLMLGGLMTSLLIRSSSRRAPTEEQETGRDIVSETPLLLCGPCAHRVAGASDRRWLQGLLTVMVATGLFMLMLVNAWIGLAELGLAAALWWNQNRRDRAHQAWLHECLREVPEYAALLEAYPDAEIIVGRQEAWP